MNVTVSYERYFVMKEQKCYFKKSKMNFSVNKIDCLCCRTVFCLVCQALMWFWSGRLDPEISVFSQWARTASGNEMETVRKKRGRVHRHEKLSSFVHDSTRFTHSLFFFFNFLFLTVSNSWLKYFIHMDYWPRLRSRWRDVGQVLCFACLWTVTKSKSINSQKKNKANIQSGSQSQRPIWFILPAQGASQVTIRVI